MQQIGYLHVRSDMYRQRASHNVVRPSDASPRPVGPTHADLGHLMYYIGLGRHIRSVPLCRASDIRRNASGRYGETRHELQTAHQHAQVVQGGLKFSVICTALTPGSKDHPRELLYVGLPGVRQQSSPSTSFRK